MMVHLGIFKAREVKMRKNTKNKTEIKIKNKTKSLRTKKMIKLTK
jgi:hypothetical protein